MSHMIRRSALLAMATLFGLIPLASAQNARDEQCAPFTDILFEEDQVRVEIDGRWYRLLAIDGIAVERIREGAERVSANRWQKRIAEDLTQVLQVLGHEHGDTVTLIVAPVDGGDVRELEDVPMTRANRSAVRDAREERERAGEFERFGALAALDELARTVDEHHAYAALKGVAFRKRIASEITRLGGAPTHDQAILAAQRLVCLLGDGHAAVRNWLDAAPDGRLNVLFQEAGGPSGGLVAFRRDPDGAGRLLAPGFPFVVSLDGVPVERWLEAASAYVTDGSDALVSRRAARLLRCVNLVRDELALEHAPEVTFVLRSADGKRASLTVPVTDERAIYGDWPRITDDAEDTARIHGFVARALPGAIAYLRIIEMGDREDATEMRRAVLGIIDSAPETKGLIIDVRGNGGGRRDPIFTLLPLVMREDARVVNIAARLLPRTEPTPPEGWLADRYAFPIDWTGWSTAERAAVEAKMTSFQPEWTPPKDRFSQWHAMVVSRTEDAPRFEGPVVILMDEWCFSATDIFLGAFKGVEGVTLMGAPSSGGSARSESHDLEALQRSIRLATMASYRPDGRLYDGNGVEPDVRLELTVDDLLGRSDTWLDAAIAHIRTRTSR